MKKLVLCLAFVSLGMFTLGCEGTTAPEASPAVESSPDAPEGSGEADAPEGGGETTEAPEGSGSSQ